MTLIRFLERLTYGEAAGWALTLLILLLSLIQISPLKLNPWDKLFAWIGRKANGALQRQVSDLQKQVTDMWVNDRRISILTFAREAKSGIIHSPDEWTNVLNQAEEYENFVKVHQVTNGIITQETEFIRNLYQQLSREHRIT